MIAVNTTVADREAEAAVSEFLEMRAAILGRLSPEALRCVAAIFERRMEEEKKRRPRVERGLNFLTRGLLRKPVSSAAFVVDSTYLGC
jgi:hypothetical protein